MLMMCQLLLLSLSTYLLLPLLPPLLLLLLLLLLFTHLQVVNADDVTAAAPASAAAAADDSAAAAAAGASFHERSQWNRIKISLHQVKSLIWRSIKLGFSKYPISKQQFQHLVICEKCASCRYRRSL